MKLKLVIEPINSSVKLLKRLQGEGVNSSFPIHLYNLSGTTGQMSERNPGSEGFLVGFTFQTCELHPFAVLSI